jgi:hypothetical protein
VRGAEDVSFTFARYAIRGNRAARAHGGEGASWPTTAPAFALAAIVSLAARPYLQLLPVFARDVLGGDSRLYGALMAANGVGALGGSLLTAAFARVPRKGLVLLVSVAIFSAGLDPARGGGGGAGKATE